MRWPAIALTALSLAGPVGAVDWKMYGGAEGGQVCFYDAVSIDRKPDGRLSIWTICHVSEDLENFAAKRSELIDSAARKIAANEYPPLALLLAGTSFDQMASMALEEQAADSDFSPEPKARILWELDCPKKMIRAIDVSAGRLHGSAPKWNYIAPQTNADRLLKMNCR
jgi:hypothetical protein